VKLRPARALAAARVLREKDRRFSMGFAPE